MSKTHTHIDKSQWHTTKDIIRQVACYMVKCDTSLKNHMFLNLPPQACKLIFKIINFKLNNWLMIIVYWTFDNLGITFQVYNIRL